MKALIYPRRQLLTALYFAIVSSVHAGTFSTDFNAGLPAGANIYGNASVDASGGVGDSGVLKLTIAENGQTGSFIIDDLDSGEKAASFIATFKARVGGGTATPADGFSFNFAGDYLPNPGFGEDGDGTGLTITFDSFDNGGDNPDGPEIRVKSGGITVANRKLSNHLRTGANFVDVLVNVDPDGTLDLTYNGLVLFTNFFVYVPIAGRFGFGARTGGLNDNHWIDDLGITTTTLSRPFVKSATPSGAGASPDATVQIELEDFTTQVNTNSIQMTLDGIVVAPSITQNGIVTTIQHDPPGSLLYGSVHTVTVVYADNDTTPVTNTLRFDFTVQQAPLWSLAPGSRPYVSTDVSSTPFQRSIAYNALSNHLYVISRTGPTAGLTINVLDAATGADLYRLNTNGIAGGSIILLSIAVADDGAIYAANMVNPVNPSTNPYKVYRWANADMSTMPTNVFSGDPGATARWGDTLAARGTGPDTQLIIDAQNSQTAAILTPTDSALTSFISTPYTHLYGGTVIGRSLQFGPTNTFWLKKKSGPTTPTMLPLQLIRYEDAPITTFLSFITEFHAQVGPVALDLSKGLAAGIFFITNTSPTTAPADRLIVFDVSNLSSPLPVAQYDFPTNHQANANFIGQAVFGGDRIFAVVGNNGIIAVPTFVPAAPRLDITRSNIAVVLSWSNSVPGFVLQATPSLTAPTWSNVMQPVVVAGNQNEVTDDASSSNKFYRLLK